MASRVVAGSAKESNVQSLAGTPMRARAAPIDNSPPQGMPQTLQKHTDTSVNNTGLPDALKAGVESLSGTSLDHVQVHYNSSQPASLQAHACAQGSEIHVAHEAWHVVQQAQGRVRPTMQMQAGAAVDDDAALEQEADVMGEQAQRIEVGERGNAA